MNVSHETDCTTETETDAEVPDRAQAQEDVFTPLRSVQREFRRHYVQLAGDHGLPFPVAGPGLVLLQEISEHPGVTLNEVARTTGPNKSRVSVLMSDLADQGIVRKDGDARDGRFVRLCITPKGDGRIDIADLVLPRQGAHQPTAPTASTNWLGSPLG